MVNESVRFRKGKGKAMIALFQKSFIRGKYYGYYEQYKTLESLGSLVFSRAYKNKRCLEWEKGFREPKEL